MDKKISINIEGLTKYFGQKKAVDHLNLQIPAGCVYGLLGRNGAGKSTTIRILLGLASADFGKAEILGCDSGKLTPEIRSRVGYVNEGHNLYKFMKIKELRNYQKSFYPEKWNAELFEQMLDFFELPLNAKIKKLSNGQRAQVSLALALAPEPELLIMDDPTLGLDVVIRRQFLEEMVRLIQHQGRTILFSSHILSDVERVADRIGVIDRGRLKADCSLDRFRDSVRKIMLEFREIAPQSPDIPGLLHIRHGENRIEAVVVNTSDEDIDGWGKDNSLVSWSEIDMNLEDQFIEYTAGNKSKRLFQ